MVSGGCVVCLLERSDLSYNRHNRRKRTGIIEGETRRWEANRIDIDQNRSAIHSYSFPLVKNVLPQLGSFPNQRGEVGGTTGARVALSYSLSVMRILVVEEFTL